jgi:hypothetical protein
LIWKKGEILRKVNIGFNDENVLERLEWNGKVGMEWGMFEGGIGPITSLETTTVTQTIYVEKAGFR